MPRKSTGTVDFRGNPPRWHARVSGRDEHGRKVRPWIDLERPDLKDDRPNGPDYQTAKRLAFKRAKKAERSVFVGQARARSADASLTLADLEERWHAVLDRDVHVKASTRVTYKSCVSSRAIPKLGKLPIVSLTVPVLRAWVRELCDDLEPSTVRNNAIALTRFLSDVRAEGWVALESNPMKHEDVRALLPSVEAPDAEEIVKFSKDVREALIARPELPHDRFGLYLAALLAGLRAGELRGLTFADLDLEATIPLLRVRRQFGLKRGADDVATTSTPKSKSSKREVPLHPLLVAWLTWWRDEGWAARFDRERTDADAVFPTVTGDAGRPRDPNILRRDLTAAGQPEDFVTPEGERLPYTFHAFRRTFASMLVETGASLEIIGMLAGHAGKTVTERHYMGRSLEAMADAVARLRVELPERPGVAPEAPARPVETSRESSQPAEVASERVGKVLRFPVPTQEHPIELPQLRHL